MADDPEKEAEIHKVDTVPPPADADAYSAPTKIGEVSSATWRAMASAAPAVSPPRPARPAASLGALMGQVEQGRSVESPPVQAPPKAPPESASLPSLADTPEGGVPSVYNEDEDEDEDDQSETLLHPSAKLFSLPPPTPPPARVALRTSEPPSPPAPTPPRVPEIVSPAPDDAAWPFAPALVALPEPKESRRTGLVVGIAGVVAVLTALLVWLWR